MVLLALGVNHRTAPIEIRERVAFAPEQLVHALHSARDKLDLGEVALISTCNRTDIYCTSGEEKGEALAAWLCEHHQLEQGALEGCCYMYSDRDAMTHIMRVASGLDSLVLGEPQILGQLKSAYAVAREADTLGPQLENLFQTTFSVAKQVRTETTIGANPVSIAYAAVNLAKHIFTDLSETQALLIGAGKTIDLVARHLQKSGVTDMVIANRTLEHADAIAADFGAQAILLSDIPAALHQADIIIASTASQLPILGKGAVESALKQRKHRPMYMVDIAVPRDIEPEVGELSDVYLYSVDDLTRVIDRNLKAREEAAQEAETIIEHNVAKLVRKIRAQGAVATLRAYRDKAELLKNREIEKALRQLKAGGDPQQVVNSLANSLTNKLIHSPSVQLKTATVEDREEIVDLAQELLAMPDTEHTDKDL